MSKKRIVLKSVLAALLVYSCWLGWQVLRFKTYPSVPVPSVSPANPALPSREVVGVYHIHSRYSDGRKTPDQIARIAAEAGLDFIILTDHGKPNYASLASQGWKDGLLELAGSELSVSRGHMVGLDFSQPSRTFSQNAELAALEIKALGGFSIIAHPYSKTRWSWGTSDEFSGIEIIDADTMIQKNVLRALLYLPAMLVQPKVTLLRIIDPPGRTLRKWEELNSRNNLPGQRRVYAYFSADAHFLYRAVFPVFHLHVLLEKPLSREFEPARRQVFSGLRCGRFFNAVDAAAKADGFNFWAENDGKIYPMGTELDRPAGPVKLRIRTPFPFAHETRLVCNGQIFWRSGEKEMVFEAKEAGAYHVEVYLRERSPLNAAVPWILSNPVFLRAPLSKDIR
jgi:hypothetical protein